MEIYTSRKQVTATPMTRGEYLSQFKGSNITEGLDDEGYEIKQLSNTNWSPKEKFDKNHILNSKLDKLSASEAVYGVLAYLTCRKEPVTLSHIHDASIAAEIAKEFCEANNLADVTSDWPKNLVHPSGECSHVNNGE